MLLNKDIEIARQIVPETQEQRTAFDRIITHAMRAFLVDNNAAMSAMQQMRARGGDVFQTQENHTIADTIQGLLSKQADLEAQIAELTAEQPVP